MGHPYAPWDGMNPRLHHVNISSILSRERITRRHSTLTRILCTAPGLSRSTLPEKRSEPRQHSQKQTVCFLLKYVSGHLDGHSDGHSGGLPISCIPPRHTQSPPGTDNSPVCTDGYCQSAAGLLHKRIIPSRLQPPRGPGRHGDSGPVGVSVGIRPGEAGFNHGPLSDQDNWLVQTWDHYRAVGRADVRNLHARTKDPVLAVPTYRLTDAYVMRTEDVAGQIPDESANTL